MKNNIQQALTNAETILKSVLKIGEITTEIASLTNLHGLTDRQMERLENAINSINLCRSELLQATHPSGDIFNNMIL